MPTQPLRFIKPIDQAAALLGALLGAAESGRLEDLFSAYKALLSAHGRQMTTAETIQRMPTWSRCDLKLRISLVVMALWPALKNADQDDSEKHWRKTDGYIKAIARSEALACQPSSADAEKYSRFATMDGWV